MKLSESKEFRWLVRADIERLHANVELDCSDFAKSHLLIQSIEGHAREGHGAFRGYTRYPDVVIEDIIEALGKDVSKFKLERQIEIDKAYRWVQEVLRGEKHNYLMIEGEPLFGINILRELKVNPEEVLTGMYLGSVMDSFHWRQKVFRVRGHQMGGGKCIAVNRAKLAEHNLTISDISQMEHKSWYISMLREMGISPRERVTQGDADNVCGFLRLKHGPGVSDDGAFINAGILYSMSAALGLFVCDGMDTWDKCSTRIVDGGQDEHLGKIIRRHRPHSRRNLPPEDEAVDFIYISAVSPYRPHIDPDCSQRYFLQMDKRTGLSAVRSHIKFIRNVKKYISETGCDKRFSPRQRIGFNRVNNVAFYDRVIKPRLWAYVKKLPVALF